MVSDMAKEISKQTLQVRLRLVGTILNIIPQLHLSQRELEQQEDYWRGKEVELQELLYNREHGDVRQG